MNPRMTNDAVLKLRTGDVMETLGGVRNAVRSCAEPGDIVVTLQTQREGGRPRQQPGVRTAVRIVASRAALNAHRGMLKDEWPAFIRMAADAGDIVARGMVDHASRTRSSPSRLRRAVRVVTIRALHGALIYPMLERQIKAGADI